MHGFLLGKTFLMIFALISNKTENCYSKLFRILKEKIKLEPRKVIFDYEKAIISSMMKEFIKNEVKGCNFHFGQAIWRSCKNIGLQTEYTNNPLIKKIIRHFLNLTFVPEEHIVEGCEHILNEITKKYLKEIFNELRLYFERNFIGKFDDVECVIIAKPIYAVKMWNSYKKVINICQEQRMV